jgi:hypothetical protein
METKFKITIPKPCHEDWNNMSHNATGRFCGSCTKTVVDFTKMKPPEIQEYFIQNQGKSVCGHFKNEQINKFDIQIPQSVLRQQMSFHKAFLLLLFVVMGSTLFSCKNNSNQTLGEVTIEDTIQKSKTTIGLPVKDSIIEEGMVDGMVKPIPITDSIKIEKK